MSEQPGGTGNQNVDEVVFRVEAWLNRLEQVTSRLEEIEKQRLEGEAQNGRTDV